MRFKKCAFFPDFQGLVLMVPRKLEKKGQEKKSGPPPITFNWWGLMNQKKNENSEEVKVFDFASRQRKNCIQTTKMAKEQGKKRKKSGHQVLTVKSD